MMKLVNLLSFLIKDKQLSLNIHLITAGELSNMLTHAQKSKITHLTLSGCIDARDFKCLRDEFRKLIELDIAYSNISAYEGIDGTCEYFNSYKANELPIYSFYNCYTGNGNNSLTHISLSRSFTLVTDDMFFGCNNLKVDKIETANS